MATINGTPNADGMDGTQEDDVIDGHGGDDIIYGYGGNDKIYGNIGRDTIFGEDGNDEIDGGSDSDFLYGGEGNDLLISGGITPWAGEEFIYGQGGDDTLRGAGGNLYGGTGNDIYYAVPGRHDPSTGRDYPPDRVFENVGEGFDTVFASNWTLDAGQEVELIAVPDTTVLQGPGFLTGNEFAQRIVGGESDDTLTGLGGDDVIDGGRGVDRMDGGAGSDTYYVDHSSDVVIEPVAEGIDRVATSASYNLPGAADIEIFEAVDSSSTTALSFGGNNFGQTIVGNAGSNVINGGGGDDTLVGLAGDDTLIGSPGNDTMHGGTGNDVYFIDALGDAVYENAGEGTDRVATTVSYVLAANASIETFEAGQLSSTTALDLTGSSVGQYVIGNSGNNVLNGGGGNDWLIGYTGNDTLIGSFSANTLEGGTGDDVYFVFDAADYIYERSGEGSDRVAVATSYALAAPAEVETLETTDAAGLSNLNLTGNGFAQTIVGNGGANLLDGKGGNDVLVGLAGGDSFRFTTALGPGNVDLISGFQSGSDKIALDNGIFAGIGGLALTSGAFATGSQAGDADDRIIYDAATGALYYDADGSGAAAQVQFATLEGHPALTGSDFLLV